MVIAAAGIWILDVNLNFSDVRCYTVTYCQCGITARCQHQLIWDQFTLQLQHRLMENPLNMPLNDIKIIYYSSLLRFYQWGIAMETGESVLKMSETLSLAKPQIQIKNPNSKWLPNKQRLTLWFQCEYQAAESVHRQPGTPRRDHRGLLENAVGAQLHHHCHAHQTTRDGPGKRQPPHHHCHQLLS